MAERQNLDTNKIALQEKKKNSTSFDKNIKRGKTCPFEIHLFTTDLQNNSGK